MRRIIMAVILFGSILSCVPDTTTLKYGQTGQDGDSLNGDYDSNNFAITQTFKWQK